VVGLAVLLRNAQTAQLVLQGVAAALAAGQPGGEDHAVVRGGRGAVGGGGAERGKDGGPGDPIVGGGGQGVPGMVIEPGQDLGAGPVRQRIVGEVGLPALVRLLGLEPQVGGLGPLARLGGDQPVPGQVPADRRGRDPDLVVVLQVPGDRVRARVQALPGQLLAQPDDQLDRVITDRRR